MTKTLDPDRIYSMLIRTGHTWATKKKDALKLEKTEKIVLANLVLRHLATSASKAEAEQKALADPIYSDHIEASVKARWDCDMAEVDYNSAQSLMELRRSQEATRRAEANLV